MRTLPWPSSAAAGAPADTDGACGPVSPRRGPARPSADAAPAAGASRALAAAPADDAPGARPSRVDALLAAWQRHGPLVRRWAVPVLALLVLGMLFAHARSIDWRGARSALAAYPLATLALALGVAAASHALYGSYDLIGRHHTAHRVPAWRTWATAVASYAVNLNLGSLVGGIALRVRLYARAGLDEATVAQVVGISLATNWLGYGLVAGSLFAAGAIEAPDDSLIGDAALRGLGAAMLLLAAAYVAACGLLRGRRWQVRGRTLALPAPGTAFAQLALAATNWSLMGTVLYLLLGRQIPYGEVLGALMAASVVGVFMPVPGGLGVLEAVVLALLSGGRVGEGALLAAVVAYRALYYLVPLAVGLVLYALLERLGPVPEALPADGRAADTAHAGGWPGVCAADRH
ncbi:lysylphosphatidylglycerol synthase domain-containing protein [Piscinibacter sakaiensis]|uniref:lysylphosphatidylglycerol synthase domain-containing protein n=1 Tax=Piscinibacter sakaiensis TaxID=1547922 RepID=UPI0009EC286D|nr:lysylphosphatidylglycerol synthase domain-containing protein [Piscinibacter sakaiensis]